MTIKASLSGGWSGHRNQRQGPVASSAGNLYSCVIASGNVVVQKSTDGGTNWAQAGATGTSALSVSAVQVGDVLHVAHVQASSVSVRPFNLSTDSWGTATSTASHGGSNISGTDPTFLVVRSNGNYVVFHQGATVASMGTAYRRLAYSIWNGSSWTTTQVTHGTATEHVDARAAVLGANDRVHLFYTRSGSNALCVRTLTAANVLGTEQTRTTVIDNASNYPLGLPARNDAGLVLAPYRNTTNARLDVERAASADAPTWTTETASPNDVNGATSNPASFAADGDVIHSLHVRGGSLWRRERSAAGSWGTEAQVYDPPAYVTLVVSDTANGGGGMSTTATFNAQSFLAPSNGIRGLTVAFTRGVDAPTADVVVALRATRTGAEIASFTVSPGEITSTSGTSPSVITRDFTSAATGLTPGAEYWITTRVTASTPTIFTSRQSGNPYPDGTFWLGGSQQTDNDMYLTINPVAEGGIRGVSSNVYTRSGTKVLGYLIDDAGILRYGEVSLGTGPVQIDKSASDSLGVGVTEQASFATVEVSASDSLGLSVGEDAQVEPFTPPKFEDFSDDFESGTLDPSKWSIIEGAQNVSITNGRLRLVSDSAVRSEPHVLTGSSVAFERWPSSPHANHHNEATISFGVWDRYLLVDVYEVSGQWRIHAESLTHTFLSVAYSSTDHRWVRFSESGGTVHFETSPDGQTWTSHNPWTSPPSWIHDVASLQFAMWDWSGGGNAVLEIDNVNELPADETEPQGDDDLAVGLGEAIEVYEISEWSDEVVVEAPVEVVPKEASDGLVVGVDEAIEFAPVVLSATDDLNLGLEESTQFATVEVAANDDLDLGLVEDASFPPIEVAAEDGLALTLDETADVVAESVFQEKDASDDLAVALDEATAFATVEVVAQDEAALALQEETAAHVTLQDEDTLLVGVDEAVEFGVVEVSASDTLNVAVGDTATPDAIALSASDDLGLSLVEDVAFAPVEIEASDTLTLDLVEEGSFPPISLFVADETAVGLEEQTSVHVALEASDDLSVALGEQIEFGLTEQSGEDELSIGADEAVGIYEVSAWSDEVLVTEEPIFLEKSASDSLAVQVAEDTAFGQVSVSATDTVGVGLVEAFEFAPFTPQADDQISVALDEQASVAASGLVTKTSSDDLVIAVGETVGTDEIHFLAASDNLAVALSADTDIVASGLVTKASDDTLTVGVDDQGQVFGVTTTHHTLARILTDFPRLKSAKADPELRTSTERDELYLETVPDAVTIPGPQPDLELATTALALAVTSQDYELAPKFDQSFPLLEVAPVVLEVGAAAVHARVTTSPVDLRVRHEPPQMGVDMHPPRMRVKAEPAQTDVQTEYPYLEVDTLPLGG